MKILGGLYTTGGVHTHPLWAIAKRQRTPNKQLWTLQTK